MRQPQQQKNRMRGRGGRKQQNPLSRNFESNGPDVKIRGNASHIAEKYTSLARDALSSGDTVMAENYFQHAEHYNRIIAAAQTNQQNQNKAEDQANGRGPQPSTGDDESVDNANQSNRRDGRNDNRNDNRGEGGRNRDNRRGNRDDNRSDQPAEQDQPVAAIGESEEQPSPEPAIAGDETENKPRRNARPRKPRKAAVEADASSEQATEEAPKKRPSRARKVEASSDEATSDAEAADSSPKKRKAAAISDDASMLPQSITGGA